MRQASSMNLIKCQPLEVYKDINGSFVSDAVYTVVYQLLPAECI